MPVTNKSLVFDVEEFVFHPNYNISTGFSDIVLLRLNGYLQLSDYPIPIIVDYTPSYVIERMTKGPMHPLIIYWPLRITYQNDDPALVYNLSIIFSNKCPISDNPM